MPDEDVAPPKSDVLRAMYWRSEILQVMYWLQGEGLGDLVDAPLLERFLGVGADKGVTYLERLVDEGYLTREGEWYSLSDIGLAEGSTEFAMAFSDLTRPAHGECSDDCWCHASVEEAEACLTARDHSGHGH